MTKQNFYKFPLVLLSVSTLVLSACAGGTTQGPTTGANTGSSLKTSSIDKAMQRALSQAEASGNRQEVLALLGQINARNPEDVVVATRYGRALREDNQINASIRALSPFTQGESKNVDALTEMAMTQIAFGDFEKAEDFAQQSIQMDTQNARGYLALGTAQDAQKHHQDAEISFREGLKYWRGDATPILNNLALNLASQGHLREALSLLEKAQKLSPGRMDLERNRRIIATLVETSEPMAPPPPEKPHSNSTASPSEETTDTTGVPTPQGKPQAEEQKMVESEEKVTEETSQKDVYQPVVRSGPPKMKVKNLKTTTGAPINN